ncbi:MAG: GUN4 domain-containing protein [Cyanobacteriota bacterium]|nr:GUN4 domain-containing protein [Cyanobacteriota bacterium]
MTKKALLIGINRYEPEFFNLPSAVKDVKAVQKRLVDKHIGDFQEEDVIVILPEYDQKNQAETGELTEQSIQDWIYDFFTGRNKDDVLILYFSGHALINKNGHLFFAATDTKKYDTGGELIESTAIPASFIRQTMDDSQCENKVVILDCCFSGTVKDDDSAKNTVDIKTELGGSRRIILSSSNSVDYPFKEDKELSFYTTALLEGIETGDADIDKDGWVDFKELHEYIDKKLEAIPNMIPQFYASEDVNKINFTKVDRESIEEQQGSQAIPLSQVELKSEREVEYTILRDLLAVQNWREADIETRDVMRLAAGKSKEEILTEEDVNQISCIDLCTIDNLWSTASKGLFGFTAQKEVCQQCINKIDYETECELGTKLGWRINNNWFIHSQLTFNLRATKGHFPCLGVSMVRLPGSFGGLGRAPIFSTIVKKFIQCTCN